jgi:flagellar hook-associated protein 3 FlgL
MRAKELAIQQAGDVGVSEITRKTVAEEIGQLYKQFLKIANTQVAGRHIFAGFKTDTPPFDFSGQYMGDNGEIDVEMDENVFMPINMPGHQIFLGENRSDGETGIDIFGVLNRLKTGLLTNNKLMIQGTLEDLDYSQEQIIFARAKVGSRLNSLDRTDAMHLEKSMSVLDLISKVEDADVYQAFSDLTKNEHVLKATLASTAKVVQPSLLDFLR